MRDAKFQTSWMYRKKDIQPRTRCPKSPQTRGDFGQLVEPIFDDISTGPDGFNFIKMFTRVVSRLRINSLNNIYGQLMSHIRQVLKVCFCTLVVQIGRPRNL